MPKLLHFVPKTDPILREVMSSISNINADEVQDTIKDMCYSIQPKQLEKVKAAHQSAAGMAANQWGIRKRIFIFTPEGSEPNKKCIPVINPSYVPYLDGKQSVTMSSAYEGCFSIPLTTGLINRYDAILATYYTQEGEKIEKVLEGWEARVFQHETDHLNGMLYDGRLDGYKGPECIERIIFKNLEEMDNFWNNKIKPSREEE